MSERLAGVIHKIERAEMHLECFGNLADKFNEGKLDSLTRQFHADTREFIWKVGEIRRPVPDMALTVGDFLNNARSALDHLAYQLVMFPAHDPGGSKAPEDKITFPITSCDGNFTQSVWKIEGADPGAIAAIKDVQPYHEWQSPHLAFLHELNNWDKHRVLHLAETEFSEVGYLHPERVEQISAHTPGRLKPGAVIAHYRVLPGYDVDVGFYIATDIALQHGMLAGRSLRPNLEGILHKVKDAFWRLAPFIAP